MVIEQISYQFLFWNLCMRHTQSYTIYINLEIKVPIEIDENYIH